MDYWSCALEDQKDGGKHFHTALKLSRTKRWLSAKNALNCKYNIVVNFSESHDNYYSAYKYICKSETLVCHSANHANLKEIGSPKTKHSTKACRKKKKITNQQNTETEEQGSFSSKKRLNNFDVSEFLVGNSIKTTTELFAKANEEEKAGKTDLANFIWSRSSKSLNDLIDNTWAMEGASAKIARRYRLDCLQWYW